jgi:hypothetical protein
MNDHKKILQLIEAVDPNDTDTLDEIDARVCAYVFNAELSRGRTVTTSLNTNDHTEVKGKWFVSKDGVRNEIRHYTRSRDALKSIRPEGWFFTKTLYENGVCLLSTRYGDGEYRKIQLPTEELAELHAIISAIHYERGQHD